MRRTEGHLEVLCECCDETRLAEAKLAQASRKLGQVRDIVAEIWVQSGGGDADPVRTMGIHVMANRALNIMEKL